jgi:hypothetical protein
VKRSWLKPIVTFVALDAGRHQEITPIECKLSASGLDFYLKPVKTGSPKAHQVPEISGPASPSEAHEQALLQKIF